MEIIRSGFLEWDPVEVSSALRLGVDDVLAYFRDGRRVSFILERRIAYEVIQGSLAPSEGAGFDIVDPDGRKWEVRCITRRGINFSPSHMIGSGRSFKAHGFLEKLDDVAGYILCDIEEFPKIPYWQIPSSVVRRWWDARELGTSSKISRLKALHLLSDLSSG